MKKYINIKGSYGVETVDEFPYNNKWERQEFERCLNEYRMSDNYNYYYPSQRCAKYWKK